MKTFRTAFTILAISIACMSAQAQSVAPLHRGDSTTMTSLTSVPLDGSGVSLAFTRATAGYGLLIVTVNHNANVTGALDITMVCTQSPDGGTTNGVLQVGTTTAGVYTSVNTSAKHAVAAVGVWPWRVDVLGFKSVTCTMAAAGSAAGDTVTVITRMVTK